MPLYSQLRLQVCCVLSQQALPATALAPSLSACWPLCSQVLLPQRWFMQTRISKSNHSQGSPHTGQARHAHGCSTWEPRSTGGRLGPPLQATMLSTHLTRRLCNLYMLSTPPFPCGSVARYATAASSALGSNGIDRGPRQPTPHSAQQHNPRQSTNKYAASDHCSLIRVLFKGH